MPASINGIPPGTPIARRCFVNPGIREEAPLFCLGGQKPDAGKGSNPGRRSHTTGNSNARCDRTSDSISCRSMNLGIFPSNEKRPTCSFRLFRAGTNDKASRLVRISRLPIGRTSFPIRWQRPPLSIASCTMARALSSLAKASGSRPASGTGKRPITAKSSLLGSISQYRKGVSFSRALPTLASCALPGIFWIPLEIVRSHDPACTDSEIFV